MKKCLLIFILITTYFHAFGESNRSLRPIQFQGVISLLGTGVTGGYHMSDSIYGGIDVLNYSDSGSGSNITNSYTYNINLSTYNFFGRYSHENAFGFFAQGGMSVLNWSMYAQYTRNNGYKWGEINVSWPKSSFNYGVGWNGISSFGLSGTIMVFSLNTGDSFVEYKESGGYSFSESEKDKFNNVVYEASNTTGAYLSLGYNF